MELKIEMKKPKEIILKHNLEEGGKIQKFFTNTCYKHMDRYVPYKEGDLRKEVDIQADKIVYEMPYARYQYYGKLMVMENGKGAYYSKSYGFWSDKGKKKTLTDIDLVYHTSGTGHHWDQRMITVESNKIVREVENELRRLG